MLGRGYADQLTESSIEKRNVEVFASIFPEAGVAERWVNFAW
jgi:hypothetical protein